LIIEDLGAFNLHDSIWNHKRKKGEAVIKGNEGGPCLWALKIDGLSRKSIEEQAQSLKSFGPKVIKERRKGGSVPSEERLYKKVDGDTGLNGKRPPAKSETKEENGEKERKGRGWESK